MDRSQSQIEEIKRKRLIDNLLGDDMKDIIPYLEDELVTDISIPDSGEIIVNRFSKGIEFTGKYIDYFVAERIIKGTAYIVGKSLDSLTGFPKLEGTIPKYNARITGILPPVTIRPVISIRIPPKKIFTLEEYVQNGQMTQEQYEYVVQAIKDRKNIFISGATGSGKSTFTNACIHKMVEFTPDDNFYIVEDNPELQCNARWKHSLCILKKDAELAVQEALRFFPDRIIFGEVRDGSLLIELFKSWLTGHNGNITTIHAKDGQRTLLRIRSMMGNNAKDISENLSEVLNLVIHLSDYKVDEIFPVSEDTDSFLSGLVQNGLV